MSSEAIATRFFAALEVAFDAHRLNQTALAKRWGVSQPLVSNWYRMVRGEMKQALPGVATILRVCAVEGIDPIRVLWGEEPTAESGTAGRAQDAAVHARAVRAKQKGRLPPDGDRRGAASG
jgi:transcriptional regulator with XRE-family HTH domain